MLFLHFRLQRGVLYGKRHRHWLGSLLFKQARRWGRYVCSKLCRVCCTLPISLLIIPCGVLALLHGVVFLILLTGGHLWLTSRRPQPVVMMDGSFAFLDICSRGTILLWCCLVHTFVIMLDFFRISAPTAVYFVLGESALI